MTDSLLKLLYIQHNISQNKNVHDDMIFGAYKIIHIMEASFKLLFKRGHPVHYYFILYMYYHWCRRYHRH